MSDLLKNPYIQIMRPDHWFKNIFMLPGMAAALLTNHSITSSMSFAIIFGIIATSLAASANYTINEYLDREFDLKHPQKKDRPCAKGLIRFNLMMGQYFLLCLVSLSIAGCIGKPFFVTILALLIMGIIYNVNPIRSKDKPFIDVITESVNNPIRFLAGWFCILASPFPPSSALLAFWFGGAFLMTIKRFAELRQIGEQTSQAYRPSFKYYTEDRLMLAAFFHALCAAFFLGVLLYKYRIEMILTYPFISLLFMGYLHLGFKKDSVVQHPEKLYKEGRFLIFGFGLILWTGFLLIVDIPWLHIFLVNNFS